MSLVSTKIKNNFKNENKDSKELRIEESALQ